MHISGLGYVFIQAHSPPISVYSRLISDKLSPLYGQRCNDGIHGSLLGFIELNTADVHYQQDLWPQLESVIDTILTANTDQARRVSFEENYRFEKNYFWFILFSNIYVLVCIY